MKFVDQSVSYAILISYVVVASVGFVLGCELRSNHGVQLPLNHPNAVVTPSVAPELMSEPVSHTKITVKRTFYCATGPGCDQPICGGNDRTAWNKDATVAGGFAVDKRWMPYGTKIQLQDGTILVADDTFGRAQREKDWEAGIKHIDIRVAGSTHNQVRLMGNGMITIEVIDD